MTVTDIIRLPDCPACNRPRWVSATCECGDPQSAHTIGVRAGVKARTQCTRYGCECKTYTKAIQDPRKG